MKTVFNKENFYTEQVEAKVNELKRICSDENLPMFIAVCVSNDAKETVFKKDAVTAGTIGLELTSDIIPKLIDITLGFDAVLPKSIPEVEFE